MSSSLHVVLRALSTLAAVSACLILALLLLLEWRPIPVTDTPVTAPEAIGDAGIPGIPASLSLVSWNIGYAGLDSGADFFMDGGREVRPRSRVVVEANLHKIAAYVRDHPADLVLLQEVDRNSSRSFHLDESRAFRAALPGHASSFAPNFRAAWIPYPVLQPLGKVDSGLLSLSRNPLASARRRQLPGAFPWPVRVFHLKRCLHELYIPAADGHDWVILHLHLSTFDRDGRLRRREMEYLRRLMVELYNAGNHVLVGGDWNQTFPGVEDSAFSSTSAIPDWFQRIPADWTPGGWRWAFDRTVPSLRSTDQPYVPGRNFVTIMDGFLMSPDLVLRSVKTEDLGFASSDHQPVRLEVALPVTDPKATAP